jgi:hypothetical protein
MAPERRTATLLAFAQAFERTAMDDALDLFDLLVTRLGGLLATKERGHWFSVMGTVLPFEIITYAI